jgi:hypothetical protein
MNPSDGNVTSKVVAGIDVADKELEVALEPQRGRVTVPYTGDSLRTLVPWLSDRGVARACPSAI